MIDPTLALAVAKNRIAAGLLSGTEPIEPRLGRITLRPHQLAAVARLLETLASYRGALLADGVGLGKTYIALAVARAHDGAVIVAPAALRRMWERALESSGVAGEIISMESLSRGERAASERRLTIVDEAHHLRTPGTRRYLALAELSRHSRVLLISATPLQNSRRDLASLVAIFAGSVVREWSDADLARVIVRRDERLTDQALPAVDGPHVLNPGVDDDCLDLLLAIPPAVPALDEGIAAALQGISLAHLWASSRAALVSSLRKRRAKAVALLAAIETGGVPTAAELRAWHFAEDALQLAIAFPPGDEALPALAGLRETILLHLEGLERALDGIASSIDPDLQRADTLRMLRRRHLDQRVVAFSQYAHTVSALGRILRSENGVAIVSGSGARIASGAISRDEVLRQFAGGSSPVKRIERIDLLLTTDLLSEGVDLRGAAVIVNLDLPWNPARLEQRIGRARRAGSSYSTIHVYSFVPPAAAERMLELRRRLARKIEVSEAIFGGGHAKAVAPVQARERLHRALEPWRAAQCDPGTGASIACARSRADGWLALCRIRGMLRLVGKAGESISEDPALLLGVIDGIGEALPQQQVAERAQEAVRTWLEGQRALEQIIDRDRSPAKRNVVDRLAITVARAARHQRPTILAAAHRARKTLEGVGGLGVERALADLALSTADDANWIQAVESLAERQQQRRDGDSGILAIIVLVRDERCATPEGSARS